MTVEFKPTLKYGDVIYIKEKEKFYRVKGVEPIPLIEKDFGAITAGSTKSDQEVEELYVKDLRLAQYRIYIVTDNIEITIAQPKARKRYATKKSIGKITRFHALAWDMLGPLTEIWIFEDENKIYFDVKNVGSTDVSESKVYFIGYQYELEEYKGTPPEFKVIELEALG